MPAKGFRNSSTCKNIPAHPLKTATALADPVLVRLSNASGHTLILAQVAAYDRAGEIHLDRVRYFRTRRGLRSILPSRFKSSGRLGHLTLQTSNDYIAARIPAQPCVRVASKPPHFAMKHLTREQAMQLRASSPRRFAAKALQLTPVSSRPLPRGGPSGHYAVKNRASAGYAAIARSIKRLALSVASA